MQKELYVVWCPSSTKPVKRTFKNQEKAEQVALQMAAKYSEEFLVLRAVSSAKLKVETF